MYLMIYSKWQGWDSFSFKMVNAITPQHPSTHWPLLWRISSAHNTTVVKITLTDYPGIVTTAEAGASSKFSHALIRTSTGLDKWITLGKMAANGFASNADALICSGICRQQRRAWGGGYGAVSWRENWFPPILENCYCKDVSKWMEKWQTFFIHYLEQYDGSIWGREPNYFLHTPSAIESERRWTDPPLSSAGEFRKQSIVKLSQSRHEKRKRKFNS